MNDKIHDNFLRNDFLQHNQRRIFNPFFFFLESLSKNCPVEQFKQ